MLKMGHRVMDICPTRLLVVLAHLVLLIPAGSVQLLFLHHDIINGNINRLSRLLVEDRIPLHFSPFVRCQVTGVDDLLDQRC